MTLKDDIITKANQTKALANAISGLQDEIISLADTIGEPTSPPPPPPSNGVYDCLPTWSGNGLVTGWDLNNLGSPAVGAGNNAAAIPSMNTACDAAIDGSIVAIGDSIIQYNPFTEIPGVVNLGNSGETMRRMMYRLNNNPSHRNVMKRAGCVITCTGINDIGYFSDNFGNEYNGTMAYNAVGMVEAHYKDLASCMGGKWIVVGALPVGETAAGVVGYNAEIAAMNAAIQTSLQTYCTADWVFVDPLTDMADLFDTNGEMIQAKSRNNDVTHPSDTSYADIFNPAIIAAGLTIGIDLSV